MQIYGKILIVVFIALLTLPGIVWFFVSPNIKHESMENRALRELPVFNALTVKEFPENFEGYYQDHLPFRNELIRLYSLIQYWTLKNVESDRTLFAKNGWMFYQNKNDGDPITNYKRTASYSKDELDKMTANILLLQQYLKERGSDFILLICPNKENVYSEYMPDSILRKQGQSNTEQFIERLRQTTDIKVIYPLEELIKAKKHGVLYQKYDTHWNAQGAYEASKAALQALEKDMPSLELLTKRKQESKGSSAKLGKGYDLAKLAGINYILEEPYRFDLVGYSDIKPKVVPSADRETRMFAESLAEGKLMMIRDSFGEDMMPILASQYRESVFLLYYFFDLSWIDREKPDVFIYEIQERYTYRLITDDYARRK